MAKTVIVGGVAGGASCAARLRRLDEAGEILLLEKGPYISYANCGLPYRVGGVITSQRALLLQTPEAMLRRYRIDTRVNSEVTAIHRQEKTVTVRRTDTGESYEEAYDTLVLATGSSPLRPSIPGIDSPRIRTLWTVPEAESLREWAAAYPGAEAVIIGGGFIGLEMAENLTAAGLRVTLAEMAEQVLPPLDYEMALPVQRHLRQKGVRLLLGDGASAFTDTETGVRITLQSGRTLEAGLVLLSIGVRPNSRLAAEAGLEVGPRGGIVTDAGLRTSDPSIYAVGDVIQVADPLFDTPTMVPLAGPANRQGRIAADNIAGGRDTYPGTLGVSVAKVFDLTAASVGANEKSLRRRGMEKGKAYETVTVIQSSHAGYYPGGNPMTIKLLFAPDGRIFGGQIVGQDGVDKRIDVLATVMRLGGRVSDLASLELAYAPPYSSAKDPLLMAGFTAENLLRGLVRFSDWDAVEKTPEAQLLDVREEAEVRAYAVPGTKHIPLGELRRRLGELDAARPVLVFCAVGVRAYNAARILMQNGFHRVEVYPGGSRFYRATHEDGTGEPPASRPTPPISRVDCRGLSCASGAEKLSAALTALKPGDTLVLAAGDEESARDLEGLCRASGCLPLSREADSGGILLTLQKPAE